MKLAVQIQDFHSCTQCVRVDLIRITLVYVHDLNMIFSGCKGEVRMIFVLGKFQWDDSFGKPEEVRELMSASKFQFDFDN